MSILETPAAPAVPSSPAERPRLTALTRLRWVAALLVFLYHARGLHFFEGGLDRLLAWAFGAGGYVGVSLFFVLSGFIIAWSSRPGLRARTFWWRRVARIWPLHLVTAALAVGLALAAVPGLKLDGPLETVANLLLVSVWNSHWWQVVNPVSWSLAVEVFFYAIFPLAYAVARRLGARSLEAMIALMVVAVVALAYADQHDWLPVHLYTFPATRLPEFLAGVCAGLLVQRGLWRGPSTATAIVVTVVGYFLTAQLPGPYRIASCTIVGIVLLIPALAGEPDRPGWWARAGERLGEWSFAFYLVHLLVLRVVTVFTGPRPRLADLPATGWVLGALIVSVALAGLLHRYVEVPCRRLLLRRRTMNPAPAAFQEGTG